MIRCSKLPLCFLTGLLILLSCFALPAQAQESGEHKEVVIERDVTVKAGKWAVARMRNMADNVELTVGVKSQGPVLLFILNEKQMKKFPKISDPLLMTRVDGTMGIKTDVRKGGNYYLLLWNKYSELPVPLKFKARVQLMSGL